MTGITLGSFDVAMIQLGEYRQAREDMKELLTAKANIDRILGKEARERNAQKEKETDQR